MNDPTPPRSLLALALALLIGVGAGLVLGRLWPWLFGEVAMGVGLAAAMVYLLKLRLDAPRGRRLALVAGALTIAGFLAGRWLAARGTGIGPLEYLEVLLTTEPIFGTTRLGPVGNTLVLVAQVALTAITTRVVGAALSVVKRGGPW